MKNASLARLSTARHDKEFASLRDLSARVGRDPLLVQASNGNTSIKLDGILWIKASGKWLAHAVQEEMFVPLELANVKASIQNDTEIASPYTPNDQLRPSIETAMHAVLRDSPFDIEIYVGARGSRPRKPGSTCFDKSPIPASCYSNSGSSR